MHWLFDFDLTLYGHDEQYVLWDLDDNISRFLMVRLNLSKDAAEQLRHKYWLEYGTTLNGLRALHDVRPEEYFDFIHSGPNLRAPRFSPAKRDLLLSLPGTRWVFTNARRDWAERGLRSMGISDCFAGIFDIEIFDWKSKPDPAVYIDIENRLNATGGRLILLDDRAANLATARQRGWRTVLVHPEAEAQLVECDLKIATILELEKQWRDLRNF